MNKKNPLKRASWHAKKMTTMKMYRWIAHILRLVFTIVLTALLNVVKKKMLRKKKLWMLLNLIYCLHNVFFLACLCNVGGNRVSQSGRISAQISYQSLRLQHFHGLIIKSTDYSATLFWMCGFVYLFSHYYYYFLNKSWMSTFTSTAPCCSVWLLQDEIWNHAALVNHTHFIIHTSNSLNNIKKNKSIALHNYAVCNQSLTAQVDSWGSADCLLSVHISDIIASCAN